MTLKLRPATAADAPILTEIYLSAFTSDAISILVFPRGPTTTEFWTSSILAEITDPHSHFLCIYDSSLPSNPIISYAKWNSPAAPPPDPNDLPTWPGDQELGNYFFENLLRSHVDIMGDRKHWYLEILGTRKEYQGRGAAGMLLKWGLERADKDGVECFIEASPEGKPVYEKYGFQEKGRLIVDLDGKGVDDKEFVEVFMVREGNKAKD